MMRTRTKRKKSSILYTLRFTQDEFNCKRYVRGGASACQEYMEVSGKRITGPKRVLIHTGARDLHGKGVKKNLGIFLK